MNNPGRWSVVVLVSGLAGATSAAERAFSFDFEADQEGEAPGQFLFGRTAAEGKPGRWVVRPEKGAPSGKHVLAQIDSDATNARYPIAVAAGARFKDGEVSVKCKPVAGKVDQACGVVLRYRDENNYYITRINALEDNVRLYYVKDGKRTQIASWSGKVAPATWHELRVRAAGDELTVSFNGKKVMSVKDQTFSDPGRAGVWTKADSVTYFDDLTITSR